MNNIAIKSNMNRRNFIKVIGCGIGGIALSSTIIGCGDMLESTEDYGWSGPDPHEKDIRMQVLAYAILCPNPHNKQPWIIRLTGSDSFDLYVDQERLLPATDPFYRQIHIGQGTFLETLAIAATGLGYETTMNYFPQGMYSNTELVNKPVASIKLSKQATVTPDPLFPHLLTRHSNKREYDAKSLSKTEIETLHAFHGRDNSYPLNIVYSLAAKQNFEHILTEAMKIEVGDTRRDNETIEMFRFNQDEIRTHRDGFGLAQAGLSGIKKLVVENFILSRAGVEEDATSFGQEAVEMARKTTASTSTFAWLSTPGNSRLDQVKVGRDYCRINLKTTAMGLVQHPMSQVLQEYKEMLPLQATFKQAFNIPASDTVQMLFRLGRAEATQHGPRRAVYSIIKK